ncbi:hypothetical protein VSS37_06005 [Candidatus Thiothrix sp. Deng01]|uniref:Uncharacterized protein n=1 Tax=Candidatus Thiothrix phosphatis TaxID=3112415 RepID=A0ABU6CVA9_9GAMM|nr:hypothetical protein [Candidatus Thiothrix sp. Deng01]MEB4590526.1 hypothetical protein [Candidatus Thiothrix sp. Deng01]
MEHENNIIELNRKNRTPETAVLGEKTYRTPTAPENGGLDCSCTFTHDEELDNTELDYSLFVDLLADEKGRKAAMEVIKSPDGRRYIVNAILTKGLEKAKTVAGINRVMRQYHSGHVIKMRAMCEAAATEETPRRFLEENIVPMLEGIGVIGRNGERSAYWQPWDKLEHKTTIKERVMKAIQREPHQLEAIAAANSAYSAIKKLKQLQRENAALERQKQEYARMTANKQRLSDMAAQHPEQQTLWGKVSQNPGALLLIGAMGAGLLVSAVGGQHANDKPMPTVQAAMQADMPQPDAGAVAAWETEQVRKQMEQENMK